MYPKHDAAYLTSDTSCVRPSKAVRPATCDLNLAQVAGRRSPGSGVTTEKAASNLFSNFLRAVDSKIH